MKYCWLSIVEVTNLTCYIFACILDPKAGEELKRHGTELPGSCFELPSHSSVTLFDRYIVLVVDTGDKGSLERAFTEALESADRMRLRSAVCNLIGADM